MLYKNRNNNMHLRNGIGGSWRKLWISMLILILCKFDSTVGDLDWMQACIPCHCQWNSGKKAADCKNKYLTNLPNTLSNELQVIDLSNNMVPELSSEEFSKANLNNLHKIFIRNSTIQTINRDAFKGLTILIELDLSHNYINEVRVGTFKGLSKLRYLVMNDNRIEILENYLFVDLEFLSRVEFKNNRLKSIELNAFGQLPLLSAIYLETNQLTVLYKETFSRIPKLLHLSLAHNPWNCTCDLQEFRDFALVNRLYTPPTACNEPANLRGKQWNEIASENFACKPRILGPPRTFIDVQMDNVTLLCRIEGVPQPNITWIHNKRIINQNDYRFKIITSYEHNHVGTSYTRKTLASVLHIYGVRSSDKGVYSCVAENKAGRTESEFQVLLNTDFGDFEENSLGTTTHTASTAMPSNIWLIICLIATTLLLLLIIVVLFVWWNCRRIKTYQKDRTTVSSNGLISTKDNNPHNSMFGGGSIIMEMQKSLLNEVNPVEKPPRRTEFENVDEASDEGPDIKKTLLDERSASK